MKHSRWFILIVVLFCLTSRVCACEPEPHFLFNQEAHQYLAKLDSIHDSTSLVRVGLLVNLSFHRDAVAWDQAHAILERLRSDTAQWTQLHQVYWWSLQIMSIRDKGKLWKLFNGARSKAREAFDSIGVALESDSTNQIIRFIRINAALECAKHIPDLLGYACLDLTYVDGMVDTRDTVRTFFLKLYWAKYYYWIGRKVEKDFRAQYDELAHEYLEVAQLLACTDFFRQEVNLWNKRLDD